ncbi:hypothetical protein F5Y16DRAFT_37147 [Xylariaceae sp. FL0255]|nr:hypothetical protein F5Y16DRAFT_37147 [Xylariaceae sp. FL0255]
METRRRTWWTLFVFISVAQLALGRPAVSLIGVYCQLPTNLDDWVLAVDMEQISTNKLHLTVAPCPIEQVKPAKIANGVHSELLTHRLPSYVKALGLERAFSPGGITYLLISAKSISLTSGYNSP